MKSPGSILAAVALVLLLSGCGPTNPPGGTSPSFTGTATVAPTTSPSAAASPSATPTPAVVAMTLDAVTVKDAGGATLESVPWNQPSAVLTLLTGIFGPPSAPTTTRQGMYYDWPGVRYFALPEIGSLRVSVPTEAGLTIEAPGGIRVGSARADVVALNPFDDGHDGDGDGKSDNLGLTPRHVPGSSSLIFPAQVGTEYVRVQFSGDTVTVLDSAGSDFGDV